MRQFNLYNKSDGAYHIENPENKTVKAIYMPSLTYLYTGINTDDDP